MEEDDKIFLKDRPEETKAADTPPSRINALTLFLLILIGFGAFFISPLPGYMMSLIPESIIRMSLQNIYQEVILDDAPSKISDPLKVKQSGSLQVLGRNSGICFTLDVTPSTPNPDIIEQKGIDAALQGRRIAEIIAVDSEKIEYQLDATTLNIGKDNKTSILCQTLGNNILIPETIEAIFIRPFTPFQPSKITWATTKDL